MLETFCSVFQLEMLNYFYKMIIYLAFLFSRESFEMITEELALEIAQMFISELNLKVKLSWERQTFKI